MCMKRAKRELRIETKTTMKGWKDKRVENEGWRRKEEKDEMEKNAKKLEKKIVALEKKVREWEGGRAEEDEERLVRNSGEIDKGRDMLLERMAANIEELRASNRDEKLVVWWCDFYFLVDWIWHLADTADDSR